MSKRAANGSGSIRRRKDGRWEARYTAGRHPGTGKQVQKSIYGTTQAEVRKKLQQVEVDIDNGTHVEPSKLTLGQWLDIWLADYTADIKPASLHTYKGWVANRIKPALGAVKLTELRPHMIQGFYNSLQIGEKPLSSKSIKDLHGVLHKGLSQAVWTGELKLNPADRCRTPRVQQAEIKPFDSGQIAAFLDAIDGHRLKAFYVVGLFLGLRQGELLGLLWKDVNLKDGTVTVSRQLQFLNGSYAFRPLKNNKPRQISPAKYVIDLLKEHRLKQNEARLKAGRAWNDGDFVFCDESGNHLSVSVTYHNFKRIVSGLGLPEMRLHDLRHTFAVASLLAGDDIKTLQENLGHHSAAFSLDRYGHVTEEMKQKSADRMDAYINTVIGKRKQV